MSFQDAVQKLKSPAKDLVTVVAAQNTDLLGATEEAKVQVAQKIGETAQGDLDLDTLLTPLTYIAAGAFTAADVALYATLHPIVSKLQPSQYYALPAVTRYFDHIQSKPSLESHAATFGDAFKRVTFDLENAPGITRKAEPPKKKEKSKSATPAVTSKDATPAPTEPKPSAEAPKDGEKAQKKEKKEKKKDAAVEGGAAKNKEAGGSKKGGNKAPAADEGEPAPSMIDLRVGHIVSIEKHPDADGLYVEQIDLGEETGPRTIISGLVNYIPIEQMRDKYLVAVCNLKPVSMRGIKSFGMVLCATSPQGKEGGIELVQPPAGSKPGDRVYFEGEAYEKAEPLAQLNPKKKIFETIQPGFTTLDTKEAAWVDPVTKSVHKIRTEKGVCVAPTFIGASLS